MNKLGSVINLKEISYEAIENAFNKDKFDIVELNVTIDYFEDVEIEIENMKKELEELIQQEIQPSKTDVPAAKIVWKYMHEIPYDKITQEGVNLWLSIECHNYIRYRWSGSRKISIDRIIPTNRFFRNTLTRLFWGANLVNGREKYIEHLFRDQDISVGILERAWSYSDNFIIWFFDVMSKPISGFIEALDDDLKETANELFRDDLGKPMLESFKSMRIRLLSKIFYGTLSQFFYDKWRFEEFEKVLSLSIVYTLTIMVTCYRACYSMSKIDKIMVDHGIEKQIVKLNDIPPEPKKWASSL